MNKQKLLAYLREKVGERFPELRFSVREVQKPQKRYTALIAEHPAMGVGACLDLDQLYGEVQKGMPLPEAANTAIEILKTGFRDLPAFDVTDFENYEICRKRLLIEVISTERNRELLQNVPHADILDMSLVCRVSVNDRQSATTTVTKELLSGWRIHEDQLFDEAIENAERLMPMRIDSFYDLYPSIVPDQGPMAFPALIAGAHSRYGASVIAYPDFIEKAMKKIGEPFYILPSSVDELLLLPESFHRDPEDLKKMVRAVNAEELAEEDILSDNVYYCDGTTILIL